MMESYRIDLPGSETNRRRVPPTAADGSFSSCSPSILLSIDALQRARGQDWTLLLKEAFCDWSSRMSSQFLSGASWFAMLPDGSWSVYAERSVPEAAPCLTDEGATERLAAIVRDFADSGQAIRVVPAQDAAVAMILLFTPDRTPALVLGWLLRAEDPRDESILLSIAAGFPAQLECQLEKAEGIRLRQEWEQNKREASRKEALFRMANELYAKNDTGDILSEMIDRIRSLYPDMGIDLLMTQDQPGSCLEVKPLRLSSAEDDICTSAFLEGQVAVSTSKDPGASYQMAVPISGKQGIYGVLHLYTSAQPFDQSDIRVMKVLSEAAGSSFENAKLYEQSNVMVGELRLINELTKRLNLSLKMSEIFQFASDELMSIFHADYCCILQRDKLRGVFTVQATNVEGMLNDTFEMDYGFAGIVSESKEPVIVSDYTMHAKVTSRFMQLTGARSLIAAPLVVQNEAHGVILVAHRAPGYFSYDNYKLLQVVAGHIGLALANATLHAEVRRMVITDNLTGLYSRNYLDEQVGLNQKKDFCGSLVVVDIDHFKSVNDTYGHQVGDAILIQVSRIIRSCIRDTDIAARWGGEELAIYLPQVATEQAYRIAERIRASVEEETEPSVTVSCGISEWNWQDEKISVETLFYRSDMALYRAKNEGRNRVRVG